MAAEVSVSNGGLTTKMTRLRTPSSILFLVPTAKKLKPVRCARVNSPIPSADNTNPPKEFL